MKRQILVKMVRHGMDPSSIRFEPDPDHDTFTDPLADPERIRETRDFLVWLWNRINEVD